MRARPQELKEKIKKKRNALKDAFIKDSENIGKKLQEKWKYDKGRFFC